MNDLINMNDVVTEEVAWLWPGYIPAGKLTIVRGNPGEGKTMLMMHVISRLTQGRPLPGEPDDAFRDPVNCIYQTAEDGLGDTIKPRLEANGADCSRVFVIDETKDPLSFSDERIEAAIRETKAKLFILDPLQAYLGAGVDMYRANEVRPQFHTLKVIAERTGCAIVLIEHLNKMKGMKAISRGLGSMDITGAARSVLLLAKPKAKEPEVYLAPVKSNLTALSPTLVFTVEYNRMFLEGTSEMTADELLDSSKGEYKKTKLPLAEELISGLMELGKEVSASSVYGLLKAHGISERTANEAKKNLGIDSKKQKDGSWAWLPPKQETEQLSIQD